MTTTESKMGHGGTQAGTRHLGYKKENMVQGKKGQPLRIAPHVVKDWIRQGDELLEARRSENNAAVKDMEVAFHLTPSNTWERMAVSEAFGAEASKHTGYDLNTLASWPWSLLVQLSRQKQLRNNIRHKTVCLLAHYDVHPGCPHALEPKLEPIRRILDDEEGLQRIHLLYALLLQELGQRLSIQDQQLIDAYELQQLEEGTKEYQIEATVTDQPPIEIAEQNGHVDLQPFSTFVEGTLNDLPLTPVEETDDGMTKQDFIEALMGVEARMTIIISDLNEQMRVMRANQLVISADSYTRYLETQVKDTMSKLNEAREEARNSAATLEVMREKLSDIQAENNKLTAQVDDLSVRYALLVDPVRQLHGMLEAVVSRTKEAMDVVEMPE